MAHVGAPKSGRRFSDSVVANAGKPVTERIGPFRSPSQVVSEDAASAVLLIFRVDGREHALSVENVVEVVQMVAVTPMPEAPSWVNGVINFRGRVVPLIDVRGRLGAPTLETDLATPIIVIQSGAVAAGLVVDEVLEVLTARSDSMGLAGPIAAASVVSGVVREGDRLITVLDLDRLCDGSVDLSFLADVREAHEANC
jgi:purine-binding chemotaxis protein CheW